MKGIAGESAQHEPVITRRARDHARHQTYEVEFVGGGPFDGARLHLDIVRDGPNSFRVLEMSYAANQAHHHRRRHDHAI